MAEDFTLDLDYKSTFNKHHPKLNQKQLELQYKKEWLAYKSKNKGKDAWQNFQKERGVLLASDVPVSIAKSQKTSQWGDGAPLFKVRFTPRGDITTSDAVAVQVRNWRTKFLTDGSPGTKLALKDTSKQFYDPQTGHALQVHHEKGISEQGPYIDTTIRKLLGKFTGNKNSYKEGVREFNTFKKWAFKTKRIFGDKAELYTALLRSQHVNIPGSAHVLRSKEGPFYSVKGSGGSAFGLDHNLPGESDIPLRQPQKLLDQAHRESFTPNYDIRTSKPGSIWDEMGIWHDLTYQSSKDATNLARQIANQPRDKEGNLLPKKKIPSNIREERIDTDDPKKALSVIKKLVAQYQESGLSVEKALEKAKAQYDKIRFGTWEPKGFNTKNLAALTPALLSVGDLLDAAKASPRTELELHKIVKDARDKPSWDEVFSLYKEDLKDTGKQLAITTSALGLGNVITKGAVSKVAGGVFGGPVGWSLLGISALDSADNIFTGGAFKRELNEFAVNDLAPFVNTAKKGEALTSMPDDDTLGSSIRNRQQGSGAIWDEESQTWRQYSIPKI